MSSLVPIESIHIYLFNSKNEGIRSHVKRSKQAFLATHGSQWTRLAVLLTVSLRLRCSFSFFSFLEQLSQKKLRRLSRQLTRAEAYQNPVLVDEVVACLALQELKETPLACTLSTRRKRVLAPKTLPRIVPGKNLCRHARMLLICVCLFQIPHALISLFPIPVRHWLPIYFCQFVRRPGPAVFRLLLEVKTMNKDDSFNFGYGPFSHWIALKGMKESVAHYACRPACAFCRKLGRRTSLSATPSR